MEFRVDVKIWKQKNDLWVEVVLYIYICKHIIIDILYD